MDGSSPESLARRPSPSKRQQGASYVIAKAGVLGTREQTRLDLLSRCQYHKAVSVFTGIGAFVSRPRWISAHLDAPSNPSLSVRTVDSLISVIAHALRVPSFLPSFRYDFSLPPPPFHAIHLLHISLSLRCPLLIFHSQPVPACEILAASFAVGVLFPVFGATSGAASVLPLAFILTVTAIKDVIEDYRRGHLDEEVNKPPTTRLSIPNPTSPTRCKESTKRDMQVFANMYSTLRTLGLLGRLGRVYDNEAASRVDGWDKAIEAACELIEKDFEMEDKLQESRGQILHRAGIKLRQALNRHRDRIHRFLPSFSAFTTAFDQDINARAALSYLQLYIRGIRGLNYTPTDQVM
ncbi:hypothetical protein FB45DRAFT_881022 [Roridomyces roridus]|uniref:Uncharacterized protein n=1 Tax=Roridomyces roridus TaxID=1738132 RepID=A0AAD7AY32_9AGAR|nr:hypothetical protein FB45DRAFT_881022 [Roridomyces roridus]